MRCLGVYGAGIWLSLIHIYHQRGGGFGEIAGGCGHDAGQKEVPRYQLVCHGFDMLLVGALQRFGLLNHRNDGAQLAFFWVAGNADEDLAFLDCGTSVYGCLLYTSISSMKAPVPPAQLPFMRISATDRRFASLSNLKKIIFASWPPSSMAVRAVG